MDIMRHYRLLIAQFVFSVTFYEDVIVSVQSLIYLRFPHHVVSFLCVCSTLTC